MKKNSLKNILIFVITGFILLFNQNPILCDEKTNIKSNSNIYLAPLSFKTHTFEAKKVQLMREYLSKLEGFNGIEKIDLIDIKNKEDFAKKSAQIIKQNKIIEINMAWLNETNAETKYSFFRNIVVFACIELADYFFKNYPALSEDLSYILIETLKNAFKHGNKLNVNYPIFLSFDESNFILTVFDFAQDTPLPESEETLKKYGLNSYSVGVENIQEIFKCSYQLKRISKEFNGKQCIVSKNNFKGNQDLIEAERRYDLALILLEGANNIKTPTEEFFNDTKRVLESLKIEAETRRPFLLKETIQFCNTFRPIIIDLEFYQKLEEICKNRLNTLKIDEMNNYFEVTSIEEFFVKLSELISNSVNEGIESFLSKMSLIRKGFTFCFDNLLNNSETDKFNNFLSLKMQLDSLEMYLLYDNLNDELKDELIKKYLEIIFETSISISKRQLSGTLVTFSA